MAGKKYVHWRKAKHIQASVRRDLQRERRRGIMLAAASGMMGGHLGAAFIALLLISPMVPNPRYLAGLATSPHVNWEQEASNLPRDEFYNVFRMPSFAYAQRLARAMHLPAEFRTEHGYKCSGLEGLLVLHARMGTSCTLAELQKILPSHAGSRCWSSGKISAVFGTYRLLIYSV